VEVPGVKKLIVLAALAAGVAYVVKFKSDQVKAAATKVTGDPRVQSALATASEKAGPVAASVSSAGASAASVVGEKLHKSESESDDLTPPAVPDEAVQVAEHDPVSAPEFTDTETAASQSGGEAKPDPLTDPLETLEPRDEPKGPAV
jgi:hypothetical protein